MPSRFGDRAAPPQDSGWKRIQLDPAMAGTFEPGGLGAAGQCSKRGETELDRPLSALKAEPPAREIDVRNREVVSDEELVTWDLALAEDR